MVGVIFRLPVNRPSPYWAASNVYGFEWVVVIMNIDALTMYVIAM